MKKITENELKRATNMLKEYIKVVEAVSSNSTIAVLPPPAPKVTPSAAPPAAGTAGNNSWDPTALGNQYADAGFAPAGNNSWDPTALGNQYADAGFAPKSTSSTQTPATASTSATRQTGAKKPTTAKPKAAPKYDPTVAAIQQDINARLKQMGEPEIEVDGQRGPITNAALQKVSAYSTGQAAARTAAPAAQTASQAAPAARTASQAAPAAPATTSAAANPFLFQTESVRYGEDPTLARIIGLAGL